MNPRAKTFFVWSLFTLIVMAFFAYWNSFRETKVKEITYNEFKQKVQAGELKEVRLWPAGEVEALSADKTIKYKFQGPTSEEAERQELVSLLDQHKLSWRYEPEKEAPVWQALLYTGLPIMVIIFFMLYFMRQLQAGGGKAMSFGKSKAKLVHNPNRRVTFEDVAGIDEAKDELQEIIAFLKDPKKFTRLGGRIPKGVLLMGPPGTGKTLLARAIAGEAGVPFFSISGSDFVEMFVGVGASRVRDLFDQGKKNAPCIIFIDEIDAVGRHRGAGIGGGHDEREQTLNQLLVEMDGFESNEGVILIAATNRPDVLDPALLRPGRFDRRVVVGLPDLKGREGILRVHSRKIPVSENVDLSVLARGTPGFSGADLENMVNEAALLAARVDKEHVDMADLEMAKDKVLMGAERRSMFISENEKRNTAYHEAGHALVAKKLEHSDPVHKVTIIPRGMALGLTQQLPSDDRYTYSEKYLSDQIAILMGGRIAEELVLDNLTTGAGNDLERATDLARKMVCEWGMSRKIGPLRFGRKDDNIFLGKDMGHVVTYSEQTANEIDEEIKRLVTDGYNRARQVVADHMQELHRLAGALLDYESLDGEDVDRIMQGLTPMKAGTAARKQHEKQSIEKDKKVPGADMVSNTPGLAPPKVSQVPT